MKIYSNRLTFTHYRGLPCNMSLALQVAGEHVGVGYAVCSPMDVWSRAKGRAIAAGRFAKNSVIYLKIGKIEDDVCTVDKAELLAAVILELHELGQKFPKSGEPAFLPREAHEFILPKCTSGALLEAIREGLRHPKLLPHNPKSDHRMDG